LGVFFPDLDMKLGTKVITLLVEQVRSIKAELKSKKLNRRSNC
jgi:hypothetical protein